MPLLSRTLVGGAPYGIAASGAAAGGTSAAVIIMDLSANLLTAHSAYRNSRTLRKGELRRSGSRGNLVPCRRSVILFYRRSISLQLVFQRCSCFFRQLLGLIFRVACDNELLSRPQRCRQLTALVCTAGGYRGFSFYNDYLALAAFRGLRTSSLLDNGTLRA